MPTTQTTGTSAISEEMKTFYSRQLLERALPVLVHGQFGQPRPLPRNGGKSIEFRRFNVLTANTTALTEGVTPGGNSLDTSAVTATIAQYGDFIQGSDLLDLTAFDPVLTETAQLLGEQAGLSMDHIVRDILAAGTSVQYAAGRASRITVAAGDNLTVAEIRKAVRTLKRNKARSLASGDYVAIVEPGVTYDLQGDSDWKTPSQYSAVQQIFSGEIGRLYGVRFVETTEAVVFSGAGASGIDVYGTIVLGANAYGMIPLEGAGLEFLFKPAGSAGTADPLDQRWTSGWKVAFTAKILQDLYMLRIEHAVSG